MTTYQTIKHTGNMPEGFTGIVYSDIGKFNYAAMIRGAWLKRKDHNVRWFGSRKAAAEAIRQHETASKRKIFKLVIFGINGNEERQIECSGWDEAIKTKDSLLNGRPYYSLTEVMEVIR